MAWTVEDPERRSPRSSRRRPARPGSVAKRQIDDAARCSSTARASTAVDHRLAAGQQVELRMAAPRPRDPAREGVLVYDDAHVVVIDKPRGVIERAVRGARDRHRDGPDPRRVAAAWASRRPSVPLHVVHRIDRATSGLLMFAKTQARRGSGSPRSCARTRWSAPTCASRTATVTSRRIESYLVADRGDGLRGSTPRPTRASAPSPTSRRASALRGATLCEVRLETGKTHQIRIHLAEARPPARRRDGLHPRLRARAASC